MSDNSISEDQVVEFLKTNTGFFIEHEELLTEISLPHNSGGAVSLVERQISTLRNRLGDCQTQLANLLEIARENDSLNSRLHRMTVEMFDAATLDDVIDSLQNHLRDQFQADAVEVKLFSASELKKEADKGVPSPSLFAKLMHDGRPHCGSLEKPQLDYLFGSQSEETGSVALVPLNGININGILAIGSNDSEHFHPGQGTDFLRRLGDIVTKSFEAVELPA
jgi:uncharacterized protein YigA (DUF484 family)